MNPKLLRLIITVGGVLVGLGISFGYWQLTLEPGIDAGSRIAVGYVIIALGILFALFCLWLAVHGNTRHFTASASSS